MTSKEKIEARLPQITNLVQIAGESVSKVDFIPGGRTNESFVVYSEEGHKYLARISGVGTEAFINRKKEIHNTDIANKIGVAPKLIAVDGSNLLLEFIEGNCTTGQEILFDNGNIDKLTMQLRKLHHTKEKFEGRFSFIKDFHVYKNDFLKTECSIPAEMREHEAEMYEITKWVDEKSSEQLCPVHSDIVLQNFIFTKKRAYMIDWEYSTMSDKYLDLASFCTQNILGCGVDRMFLNSYFNGAEEQLDYGKFLLYKMSISFMWVYWHLNNVAHDKDAKYNEYRWRMHLNNAIVCKEEWEQLQKCPSEKR